MTGRGVITRTPDRRLRLMMVVQISWLLLVCGLGTWWGILAIRQADRVAHLEKLLGMEPARAAYNLAKTERMIHWEGATFLILIVASTAVLFWLYWRDTRRSRSLQAFFASLTHELRTPLTGIRLQAEAISEDEKPSPALVRRLLEDTLRLESQVNRTLELARVEGGGAVFNQSLMVKPLIERVVRNWVDTYKDQIRVDSDIDDFIVQADSAALETIFKNLLDNSSRHVAHAGHAGNDKLHIKISSRRDSKSIFILFKDNGAGVQGEAIDLGGLFRKGPQSNGAGVGLYLVRVLMDRMGGSAGFSQEAGFPVCLTFRAGGSIDT